MKQLHVFLAGDPVGALWQDDAGLIEFRYSDAWLATPAAIPLSRSLPLQSDPFRGKHARPFFAGILPDEGPRDVIAAILGISARNDFAMLERIGGECAGAVSLLPDGVFPRAAFASRTRALDDQDFGEIVAELGRRPLLAGRAGLRLSLAGSQAKLPVLLSGGRVELPLDGTPSTHIIKPEPERFPGLVAVEILCMTLAKAVGLTTPSVSFRSAGGRPCIVAERYDRIVEPNGTVVRVHQEDFCQALGYPPERKYQQEGGPLLRDCIGLLREWSTVPALDIREFLDGLIFNVLIGNADAHAKNYSLLYSQGSRRLAPFYDLVCTLAWPELSTTPAMKIGRSESIETITAENWKKMAQETQVGWPMLRERIAALCGETLTHLRDATAQAAQGDPVTAERVAGIIERRAERMLHRPG